MDLKKYIVTKKEILARDIVTLTLTFLDGTIPTYRPGQYIRIYFPEILPFKGKEYSISSAPQENKMTITVRAIGRFSNKLCQLETGDIFSASLPSGLFNLEKTTSDLIMIAGGMGVTPFRGIIYNSLKKSPNYKLALFQSVRVTNDLLFVKEFDSWSTQHQNLQVKRYVTREPVNLKNIYRHRVEISDVLPFITDFKNTSFMICGSTSFNATFRKELILAGIARENIYSETLF